MSPILFVSRNTPSLSAQLKNNLPSSVSNFHDCTWPLKIEVFEIRVCLRWGISGNDKCKTISKSSEKSKLFSIANQYLLGLNNFIPLFSNVILAI